MTTPDPSDDAELFDALSAITITGPDASDLFWISFKSDVPLAQLSVNADAIAGQEVTRWRDMQSAALAKAVLAQASQPEK